MRAFAGSVLKILTALPEGVSCDGISVPPSLIDFGAEINVSAAEADEL